MTRLGILVALGLAVPGWAQAGSFEVNPVGLTLSGTHSTEVVTVTNASDSLTVVQLQVVAWSQENGEDVYTPTRNVLATPPIFTVPAGGQQTVRLGLMSKPDAKLETAYRLFLQEVAAAQRIRGSGTASAAARRHPGIRGAGGGHSARAALERTAAVGDGD